MTKPRIAIIGGGLAGMAAAVALAERDVSVELFEAKRFLGGRAGSFEDPTSGETLDHCQHVAMGCCTSFIDFAMRTGIAHSFRVDDTLHFIDANGSQYAFRGSNWLPPPLHLGPALWGLKFLSKRSRIAVASGIIALARMSGQSADMTVAEWLKSNKQPAEAIEKFWSIVLVSALGESLDRAAVSAARKVFVDGFMGHHAAYRVLVPIMPLMILYEKYVAAWLLEHDVKIRMSEAASGLLSEGDRITGVALQSGEILKFDHVILALPWRAAARVLRGSPAEKIAAPWQSIESSPITGVHLWFDRPITDLPHAVLIDRLSQWVFARYSPAIVSAALSGNEPIGEAYYQVVISASRDLADRSSDEILKEVVSDLRAAFPQSQEAQFLRGRVVTQTEAVFSVTPAFEKLRPKQRTEISGLTLAGDWTATGWPATMESAVRSGYLAAEAVLESLGRLHPIVPPPLSKSWLLKAIGGKKPRSV